LNPIELVIIGTGLIGQKHIKFVNASKRCSLAGICDVDPSREALAAEFNVPFYQNVDEMLDRERPDGAIIATPNRLHLVAAEACARHSVHMLVEKPIADTLEDAHRIVNLAEEAGVQLLVGHHRRHNPLIQQARSIVQGGSLGKVVGVSALWTLRKPDEYYEVTWRRSRPGGGPALINLTHDLDNMRFICGEIRQIQAMSSSAARGFEVEDTLSLTIAFENGALGSMLVSDTVAAPWSYELNTGENPFYPQVEENCFNMAAGTVLGITTYSVVPIPLGIGGGRAGLDIARASGRTDVRPWVWWGAAAGGVAGYVLSSLVAFAIGHTG
jgi:predicted dehydrogenase